MKSMQPKDIYAHAHLFVAAMRVLDHQQGAPPSIEKVGALLSFSGEKTHLICRKLVEMGIIELLEGAFGNRLVIKDHLKLEDISKDQSESKLDEELKKFKTGRKEIEKRVESIKAEQEQKQKELFAELEKKLKKAKTPNKTNQ
jgi:hypothetical protein